MGDSANVEVVREVIAAFNRGDDRAILDRYNSDAVLRPDPQWPESEECRGIEAIGRWFETIRQAWDTDQRLDIVDTLEQDGKVLIRTEWHAVGAASGAAGDAPFTHVYSFGDDGLIRRIELFFDHAEALRAARAAGPRK